MNFSELLLKQYFKQLTISRVLIFLYIFIPIIQSSLNPCFYHLLSPLQVQLKKLINDIKHTPLVFQISNAGPILSL